MFGSEILETVIGLIFVYLLLSVIVSSAKELIESVLKQRAVHLERGIRLLLDEKNQPGLAKQLLEHPLIGCLYQGRYDSQNKIKPSSLPSYIPARSFALALMDIVRHPTPGTPRSAGEAEGVNSIAQFRQSVELIQNEKVRTALLTLVDAAGNDAQRVRENIEAWFNSTMDRVTGWYRRWTQCIILTVGAILTVVLNADTIAIFRYLSQTPEARASLIAAAQDAARKPLPAPSAADGTPLPGNAAPSSQVDLKTLKVQLQTINGFGLPLGWSQFTWATEKWEAEEWFYRVVGWLLTALAISLGAPFWFNLLNKFMDLRSAAKADNKPNQQREPGGSEVRT